MRWTKTSQPPEPPVALGPPEPPEELPEPPEELPELPEDLAELATLVDKLTTRDLGGLADSVRTKRLVAWQRLLDRQAGLWRQELADLDASGAAATDPDHPAPTTAAWLRGRLRMGVGRPAAASAPPGPCSVAPSPTRRRRWWRGRSHPRMPG